MASGHAKLLLNGLEKNRNRLEIDADFRGNVLDSIVGNIYMEWLGASEMLLKPNVTDNILNTAQGYQRSAVATYRSAVLGGFSPHELDKKLRYYEAYGKYLDDFKAAVADLTSGKYPITDLIDAKLIEKNLAALQQANLSKAGSVLKAIVPPMAIMAGLTTLDAIDNAAYASTVDGIHDMQSGNYKSGVEHMADSGIHQLRELLQMASIGLNVLPEVSLPLSLIATPVIEEADHFLKIHTIEGKAEHLQNNKLAEAFSYLIRHTASTPSYQAKAELVAHRPDIQYAVAAFDKIRTYIEPHARAEAFSDVLAQIENNIVELIQHGEDIPIQLPETGLQR